MTQAPSTAYAGYLEPSFLASGHSKHFYSFIKRLNQTSKEQEYTQVNQHLKALSTRIRQPNVTPDEMKEALVQVIHCLMLGYNVDFSLIHAIMIAQSGDSLDQRRTGYLVCMLLLNKQHELGIMLINTLQRDLKSSNYMDNCLALNVICYLDQPEWIEHVLDPTLHAMTSSRQVVRRKAVLALYWIYRRSPGVLDQIDASLRNALVDKDLGVVFVALSVWSRLLQQQDISLMDETLLKTVLQVHQQVMDGHVERGYYYHGVPAPWAQLTCLKIYRVVLAAGHDAHSRRVFDVVSQCLISVEKKVDAAFAILLECMAVMAQPVFLSSVESRLVDVLHPYLSANNANRLYLGLSAIAFLDVSLWQNEWSPSFFIDTLRSHITDATLVLKCLDLLDKRLDVSLTDQQRQVLLDALSQCAHTQHGSELATWLLHHAPEPASTVEYVSSTLSLLMCTLQHASDATVVAQHCQDIERVIAEEVDDVILRETAVDALYDALRIPDAKTTYNNVPLMQLAFKIIGENGYLSRQHTELEWMVRLGACVAVIQDDAPLQVCGLRAIQQCIVRTKQRLSSLDELLDTLMASKQVEVQQIAREVTDLVSQPDIQIHTVTTANHVRTEQDDWCDLTKANLSDGREPIHADNKELASARITPAESHKTQPRHVSSLIDLDWRETSPPTLSPIEATMPPMDTSVFGDLWIRYKHEHKWQWPGCADVTSMVARLQQQWVCDVVAVVQQECLAAHANSTDPAHPYLLHAHWKGGITLVTVRAATAEQLNTFVERAAS
ncbi:armadillo-type protein [Gongronella butleri]|nr:armadillo-type protein [Gongronella butleri]